MPGLDERSGDLRNEYIFEVFYKMIFEERRWQLAKPDFRNYY